MRLRSYPAIGAAIGSLWLTVSDGPDYNRQRIIFGAADDLPMVDWGIEYSYPFATTIVAECRPIPECYVKCIGIRFVTMGHCDGTL